MELSGKVIAVLEPRGGVSKTGNAWKVQEYVIETHDQYPRRMCFDVFGEDKINQFNIQVGEELNVSFDIDAREYNGRWYNSFKMKAVKRENVIDAASNLKNKFDYLHYWSPFIDTNKFIFMTDKTKIHYDIVIDDKTLNLNNCNI